MAPDRTLKSSRSPGKPAKRRKIINRSVWNTEDDWQQIIADSSLSTASVSSRRPPHRGLHPLSYYASRVAARAFNFLWDGKGDGDGVWWKSEWSYVGDHMKAVVRDEVFKAWGSHLRPDVLVGALMAPPTIRLPGNLLPAIAQTQNLKPFRPSAHMDQYTSLILTHAPLATDLAIAGLIAFLPQLQHINLKGCKLAGRRAVDAMIKFCPYLKRINLKGTEVDAADVQKLFKRFGQDLEGFKIDKVKFDPHGLAQIFTSEVYPNMTHLCLPGDILNGSGETSGAKRYLSLMAPVKARETPKDAPFTWETFGDMFPALTHLALPGLLVPDKEVIRLNHGRLIKLSIRPTGHGEIPVPVTTVNSLLEGQTETMESLHLGQILSHSRGHQVAADWERLEELIRDCKRLKSFRWTAGNIDRRSIELCLGQMHLTENGIWNIVKALNFQSLRRLSIDWPSDLDIQELFHPFAHAPESEPYRLEVLELPSDGVPSGPRNIRYIRLLANLASLDLSGSGTTDEDLYQILDGCPFLHRIDLTSCRGVRVQNRRNIFKAWQEAREERTS